PFTLFKWIDNAILRLLYAVINFFASSIPIVVSAIRQALLSNVLQFLASLYSNAVAGSAASVLQPNASYPISMMNAGMLTPLVLRRLLDVVLSVLDVIVGAAAFVMKEIGILDENDDRIRVARPALEQELRALAIEFNRGSVLGRQHLYGWRSSDAMLTS